MSTDISHSESASPTFLTRLKGGANGGHALTRGEMRPMRYYDINGATGCWEWNRALTKGGYGSTRYNGVQTTAHRAFFAHYVADIPAGMVVMHSCDNRRCCNPAHLSLATQNENMADGARKGRINRGEANPGGGKLTAAQALLVRNAWRAGVNHNVIAEAFGISKVTVWEIGRGKKWKHLEDVA